MSSEKFLLERKMFAGKEFNSVMASIAGRRLWVTYKDSEYYFKVEDLKTGEVVFKSCSLDNAIEKFNEM